MANYQVLVGVSQSDETGSNDINVWVSPWTVHTWTGDTVQWVADPAGSSVITKIKAYKKSKRAKWPFDGTSKPSGKRPKTGERKPTRRKTKLAYTVYVEFTDSSGRTRSATIDPDMVIEY